MACELLHHHNPGQSHAQGGAAKYVTKQVRRCQLQSRETWQSMTDDIEPTRGRIIEHP